MGRALNMAKGNEVNAEDLEAMSENCNRKRLEEQNDGAQEWSFGDFYRIVAEAVEEINRKFGGTQLKVPSVMRHNFGGGKKIPKEEFQKLLQEVLIGAGITGVRVKEFLFFIFGVPAFSVFLKNRIAQ
ncbi:hypothetical protein Bca101_041096 [Brassica carinata]